ncbi:hypothetical protein MVEG_05894 [Podila verticillata NRRL 6337]|nr:hypothetical protein MVEG_05894 [Podila verticillata NRRL 6337]
MAKTLLWPKKWFTTSSSAANSSSDPFAPSRSPPIKKQRSFFNLASSRATSLHNWTSGPPRRLQHDEHDNNYGQETVSRTIYYNGPRHQPSLGNLPVAAISASDIQLGNSPRQIITTQHHFDSRPLPQPPSPLEERYHNTRRRASSVSTEYPPEHMRLHVAPLHFQSDCSPITDSSLDGAVSCPSEIRQPSSNWRPPVPRKDKEVTRDDQVMQFLNNLAGNVEDLSRKVSAMMALTGPGAQAPENLATRLLARTRQRASSEPGNWDDVVDLRSEIVPPPNNTVQSRHASATSIRASPLCVSAVVYRPPTPPRPRPRPQMIYPSDMGESAESLSPTIPPLPTFTPLARFGSMPLTALESMAQASSSTSESETSISPLPSPTSIDAAHSEQEVSIHDHHDLFSAPARSMFESLTNEIQRELHRYKSLALSRNTPEFYHLDVSDSNSNNTTTRRLNNNHATEWRQDDDHDIVDRAPSLSRFPRPPPLCPPPRPSSHFAPTRPSPPSSPHVVPTTRARVPPSRPAPPTDGAAVDLAEVLPRLQTRIAILEHEWPELFQVDDKPSPELSKKLEFLTTLLYTSFARQKRELL